MNSIEWCTERKEFVEEQNEALYSSRGQAENHLNQPQKKEMDHQESRNTASLVNKMKESIEIGSPAKSGDDPRTG